MHGHLPNPSATHVTPLRTHRGGDAMWLQRIYMIYIYILYTIYMCIYIYTFIYIEKNIQAIYIGRQACRQQLIVSLQFRRIHLQQCALGPVRWHPVHVRFHPALGLLHTSVACKASDKCYTHEMHHFCHPTRGIPVQLKVAVNMSHQLWAICLGHIQGILECDP